MGKTFFPVNDLLRRKLQTSLIIVSLTCSVASTLFLLLFSERIGFGIASAAEGTLTRGLSVVFSQFILFIGILIFAVGAAIISFVVFLMMSQRTRDFGLIKAAGCPNNLVFGYFMTELLIVTVVSCLLGVVFGFAADFVATKLGNFAIYQKPPDLLLAPLVFVAYFILALIFGTKPLLGAARLSPMKALSPMQYFGLSIGSEYKALSRSGLTIKIALRSLYRRKSTTVRVILLLSIVFILLTVSIAGGIIASDTTKAWVEKATGRNLVVIAHKSMVAQYELLLSKFFGAEESGDFSYLNGELLMLDEVLQHLNEMPEIAVVDARLIWKGRVQEIANFTIDPETLATIPVGDDREGDSLIVGIQPEKSTASWFIKGHFLKTDDSWEAVIGDSIAQTMFSQPLVQSIMVQNSTFSIVGVCVDPLNNGKVTYVPLRKLQNLTSTFNTNIVFAELEPSLDRAAALTQIKTFIGNVNPELTAFELDNVLDEILNFLGSTWATVMFLPLFTLISATLCLMAYITLIIEEQRQEFAILRATGAKPITIVTILAIQSLIVLLSSCAVGISLGIMTTLLILVPQPVVTSLTILQVAMWLLSALIGMFLLSLYPAAKLARAPLLKIIT